MYKQIHTPTVVEEGEEVRGGGVNGTPPRIFDMLQSFETILPLVESL